MLPDERPKSSGYGKSNQKIVGRHFFFELALQPLLTFMTLAVRTIAMTAGMRDEALFLTITTSCRHDRAL